MTEEQYFLKVEKIERLNRHHELLPKLKTRFSLVHAQYVEMILNDLLQSFSPKNVPNTEGVQRGEVKLQNLTKDEVFKRLLAKKYTIRTRLNVTINRFHGCKTDLERKDVSIAVNDIEGELKDFQKDIDYYETNRRLPSILEEENGKDFFRVPGTMAEIEKRLNTVKVSILNTNKSLEKFDFKVINDTQHKDHKAYLKLERSLKKWQELRILLVKAREKLKKNEMES